MYLHTYECTLQFVSVELANHYFNRFVVANCKFSDDCFVFAWGLQLKYILTRMYTFIFSLVVYSLVDDH